MTTIITGSEGYIGTNLKRIFEENNDSYIGMDRKTGPDLLSAEGRDLFEEETIHADVVIHLAAMPRIPASWKNPETYIRDNVQLTEYVARICQQNNCHLVFASSSSVYGDGTGPLNPYAWTKQSAENIIRIYGQDLLSYTIARIFTTYGENGPLVIDKWIELAKAGKPIVVRGDGSQRRDFIHVRDVAQALYSCSKLKLDQTTLDVGTGVNHSLTDLADLFECEVKREGELQGYAYQTLADAQATMKLLNWAPQYRVKDWVLSSLDS